MKFQWIAIIAVVFAASLSKAENTKEPCYPLRRACEKAGFELKSQQPHNKVIVDCMLRLVNGQKATSPVSGQTAQVPTGTNVNLCKAQIHRGKTTVGLKSKHVVKAGIGAQSVYKKNF